jgi:hypothetical protein
MWNQAVHTEREVTANRPDIIIKNKKEKYIYHISIYYTSNNCSHWNSKEKLNPLNPELNPICHLLALLGAHHCLHVSRIRVKLLTFRRLMSYIYIWSTHS